MCSACRECPVFCYSFKEPFLSFFSDSGWNRDTCDRTGRRVIPGGRLSPLAPCQQPSSLSLSCRSTPEMSQHPSPGWGFGALPRRRPPALPAAGAGDVPGHRPAPRARSSPAPLSVAPTARHTHREPPPHTGRGWLQLPLAPVSPRRAHPPAESRCGCLDAHPLVAEVAVSSASCALLQL